MTDIGWDKIPVGTTRTVERYKVMEGSQSAHCCFEWTVLDTEQKEEYTESGFLAVCECFERADAEKIAISLNSFSSTDRPEQ